MIPIDHKTIKTGCWVGGILIVIGFISTIAIGVCSIIWLFNHVTIHIF